MPAFEQVEKNSWISKPIAMGPFQGLQGGAVAGLMSYELETLAAEQALGKACSISVEFLRPTQPGRLRTVPETVRLGRRVNVLSNTIFQDDVPTARASLCFINSIDLPTISPPAPEIANPQTLAVLPPKKALHGRPWMMDSFEVRKDPAGLVWFRYKEDIVDGMTPMARVLGPADWTHGLGRPNAPKLADPNINLNVAMWRHPAGAQIGIQPETTWMPNGVGLGRGTLFDQTGAFGQVMMSVALTPFA